MDWMVGSNLQGSGQGIFQLFQLQTEIEEQIPSAYSMTWWRLLPEPVQIEWEVGGIVHITFKLCSLFEV
jgi:hypothetical protein